ncbi:S-adenosyl-L-methionine-dependent methyltransferases superfamily protein [Raphanus sativus]|nr:S-adenosyl-L-methionine-dependent methyltransferases superfamily protein [Raphanus sativus]
MSKTCNFLGLRVRSNPLPLSNSSPLNLLQRLLRDLSTVGFALFHVVGWFSAVSPARPWMMNNMSGSILGGKSFIASRGSEPSPVEQALSKVEWPENFPFKEEDFQRFDESSDSTFYEAPRFVTHIDDPAIAALTKYYSKVSCLRVKLQE